MVSAHAATAAIAAPATSQTATCQTPKRRSLSSKNTLSRMADPTRALRPA